MEKKITTINIPTDILKKLRIIAKEEYRSLSALITTIIKKYLDERTSK